MKRYLSSFFSDLKEANIYLLNTKNPIMVIMSDGMIYPVAVFMPKRSMESVSA